MAYIKYATQTITVGGNSETLSVNGYTTGEHKGTPTQAYGETIGAYDVALGTVHLGTVTQDYLSGSTPERGCAVKQTLTKCTSDTADSIVAIDEDNGIVLTYTATDGNTLPSTVTVKIAGATGVASTDYTWVKATGVLTIPKAKCVGDIEVTVTATAATSS